MLTRYDCEICGHVAVVGDKIKFKGPIIENSGDKTKDGYYCPKCWQRFISANIPKMRETTE